MRAKVGFLLFAILASAISINALYLQPPKTSLGADKGETIKPAAKPARPQADSIPSPPVPAQKPADAGQTVASTGTESSRQAKPLAEADPQSGSLQTPNSEAAATPVSREAIRGVQRELARRGYRVGADDGRVRLMTREAIIAYEFDRHLALTGEPTENLLKDLLFSGVKPKAQRNFSPERFEADAELVRRVQNVLASLGYGPSLITGTMDEPTREALKQFQTERNLAVNGHLSERLLLELVIVTGKPLAAEG